MAAAVLYVTITSLIDDPTEPWELVGQVFFWWPVFLLRTGLAIPLAALWWLGLAWALALAINRARERLSTAA
mgnify:FL=1